MVWSLQAVPPLSDSQFAQWSKLLEDRAGIYLSDQQRVFLQTQVAMRMRSLGYDDFSAYYDHVVDGLAGMLEWTRLIDHLVVNETSFFRHRPSTEFIGQFVQERLLKGKTEFDLWSVGCSSGEEPYSLGMVINDAFEMAMREPRFSIVATDISRAALSLAKTAVYGARKLEILEPRHKQRYFQTVAPGQYQVSATLRDRTCFNQGNVLNINEMPEIKVDAIYCQNLLVYFRRWLREHILSAFVERLKSGGVLVIGVGEIVDWCHPQVTRLMANGVQAYKKN